MTEPTRIYRMDTGESVRVDLPDGIGYVEIRANNVHGPTGYPAIGVSVVSQTLNRPAADGRLYEPVFKFDGTEITLVGNPGPQLREAMKLGAIIKAHDSGDHTRCPDACPALAADSEDQRLIRKYDGNRPEETP